MKSRNTFCANFPVAVVAHPGKRRVSDRVGAFGRVISAKVKAGAT